MRKVVVLPREVYDSMQKEPHPQVLIDPKKQKLVALESELQAILNNSNIEIHEKKTQYLHYLQKLLSELSEYKVSSVTEHPGQDENVGYTDPCSKTNDKVLCMMENSMTAATKSKGMALYNAFKAHPTIYWNNQTGEITIDGFTVIGSNIVDICIDLTKRWKRSPPLGWNRIMRNLSRGGFAHTLINNPTRLSELNRFNVVGNTTPSGNRTPNLIHHSPSSITSPIPLVQHTPFVRTNSLPQLHHTPTSDRTQTFNDLIPDLTDDSILLTPDVIQANTIPKRTKSKSYSDKNVIKKWIHHTPSSRKTPFQVDNRAPSKRAKTLTYPRKRLIRPKNIHILKSNTTQIQPVVNPTTTGSTRLVQRIFPKKKKPKSKPYPSKNITKTWDDSFMG